MTSLANGFDAAPFWMWRKILKLTKRQTDGDYIQTSAYTLLFILPRVALIE